TCALPISDPARPTWRNESPAGTPEPKPSASSDVASPTLSSPPCEPTTTEASKRSPPQSGRRLDIGASPSSTAPGADHVRGRFQGEVRGRGQLPCWAVGPIHLLVSETPAIVGSPPTRRDAEGGDPPGLCRELRGVWGTQDLGAVEPGRDPGGSVHGGAADAGYGHPGGRWEARPAAPRPPPRAPLGRLLRSIAGSLRLCLTGRGWPT